MDVTNTSDNYSIIDTQFIDEDDPIDPDINFFNGLDNVETKILVSPYNDVTIMTNNALFILNFNIRSLNKNFDDLKIFLSTIPKMNIICLQETWAKNEDEKSALSELEQFKLEGYKMINIPRGSGKRGGGTCFYISD